MKITAYTDSFVDEIPEVEGDEDTSYLRVPAIKTSIQGCLFARCCKCSEKLRETCEGVTIPEWRVETVSPHVRNPLCTDSDPIRIVAEARVFVTSDFDPSHTPCLGGK